MTSKKTEAEKMGSTVGGRVKKNTDDVRKRPDRGDAVSDMMLEFTLNVRQNIKALMDVEAELDTNEPLTYNQLGKLSGYSSSVIYQSLTSEPPRNNIGIQTVVRYALALGTTPYTLLMPHADFKKTIIPGYRQARMQAIKSGEVRTPIQAPRSAKKPKRQ